MTLGSIKTEDHSEGRLLLCWGSTPLLAKGDSFSLCIQFLCQYPIRIDVVQMEKKHIEIRHCVCKSHRRYPINYALRPTYICVVNDFRLNSVERRGNIRDLDQVIKVRIILKMCVYEIMKQRDSRESETVPRCDIEESRQNPLNPTVKRFIITHCETLYSPRVEDVAWLEDTQLSILIF